MFGENDGAMGSDNMELNGFESGMPGMPGAPSMSSVPNMSNDIFGVPFGTIATSMTCAHCGKPLIGHYVNHMLLPHELGGTDDVNNFVYLCEDCAEQVEFTVNIAKTYPYLTSAHCANIMSYMDSQLKQVMLGDDGTRCEICGSDATKTIKINGVDIPVCDGCWTNLDYALFPNLSYEKHQQLSEAFGLVDVEFGDDGEGESVEQGAEVWGADSSSKNVSLDESGNLDG